MTLAELAEMFTETIAEHKRIHALMQCEHIQIAQLDRVNGMLTIEPRSYTLPSAKRS